MPNPYLPKVASVTGRHSVYFVFDDEYSGYLGEFFKGRPKCELESFVFHK